MDNCGVNVNWYIVFDFMKGWSVWLMFLGWFNIMYFDWYVVVEMLNVMRGLQEVYIMNVIRLFFLNNSNGDLMINNIFVFMGLEGYNNYLMFVQNFILGKI